MSVINASCIAVYRATWFKGWQWSVAGPHGMTFGAAPTEEKAWVDARAFYVREQQVGEAMRRARGQG